LPYYFNAIEKISRWEPPPGTDTEKLKLYMAKYHSGSMATEGAQPGKIRAAHLLVKHRESRRPMSWREVGGFLDNHEATAVVTDTQQTGEK
jgi:NIMA-interacting peptidyl-prolyl cis-trans isomerase 1